MALDEINNTSPSSSVDSSKQEFIVSKKRRNWGKIFTVILILVLLAGNAVLGYMLMKEKDDRKAETAKLTSEVSSTKKALEVAKEDKTEPATPQSTTAKKYREIPELGIKYELTDETAKLTYEYMKNGAGEVLQFSTTDLVGAMDATNSPQQSNCNPDGGPVGIVSVSAPDTKLFGGEKTTAQITDKKVVVKIGDKYFLRTAPQSACSDSDKLNDIQTKGIGILEKAFQTMVAL